VDLWGTLSQNVYAKSNYVWLRTNKALAIFHTSDKKKNKKNLCSTWGSFRIQI